MPSWNATNDDGTHFDMSPSNTAPSGTLSQTLVKTVASRDCDGFCEAQKPGITRQDYSGSGLWNSSFNCWQPLRLNDGTDKSTLPTVVDTELDPDVPQDWRL